MYKQRETLPLPHYHNIHGADFSRFDFSSKSSPQGVTKRCRLSWLTNSALVYEHK
jgi:hypothetical protein